MSFGFGSNNNNTTGGFGAGGFGNSGTGFGANTNNTSTGGSLFGNTTATSGGGAFGFGANNNANNNNNIFGQSKPATGFGGSTTGTSLFGNNAAGANTFGGFGSNAANNTTSAFGGGAGGGLFGNKPATTGFGATNTTGNSLFGSGATSGGFGSTTNNAVGNPFSTNNNSTASTSPFGATANTTTGFGGFGASSVNNNSGTSAVPFQALIEKEASTNTSAAYQSLAFQDPYKNKSFEELRVEDYMQGRRYGNSNGQAGGFGQSTGFGGFGATNNAGPSSAGGGIFGANTNTTAPATTGFGAFGNTNNNASTTFGSNNTSGGLFGANKPPAGGLFGASTTTPTTGGFGGNTNTAGGLFGNTNNNTFGASNTGGSSLFGNTNNATQANAFGTNTATAGGGLFGANAAQNKPATSLFGSATNTNTGSSLFGAQNNTQPAGGSLFGASTNTNTGGSLFGNATQQAKPTAFGGFGNTTNTATPAFGATNTNAGTSLFGNTSTTNTGGSLFGNQNQANKPGGLFGGMNNNTTTGSSLFGNPQPQTGSSLFGGTQNNTGGSLFGNNAGKSLFGNSTAPNTAGTSLFGANQPAQNNGTGTSLFGNNGQSNGNSLFGNSQSQQPAANQLHASLTVSPYGNDQLFASLAAPAPPVGPLATPLSGAKPTPRKTQSLLSSVRLNSPVYTPRASTLGRTIGYGISYSNFGTPNSSFSATLTPGATSLLRPSGSLSGSMSGRLNKSFSTSNLRGDATSEGGSILRPSPLTPGITGNRYGSGSMRKLRIDRTLRQDLFESGPRDAENRRGSDARRVNFETAENNGEPSDAAPTAQNALVTEEQARDRQVPEATKSNLFKTDPRVKITNGHEVEQINGSKSLTTVPETTTSQSASAPDVDPESPTDDVESGNYWSKPTIQQLKKMPRKQLEKVENFTVGRSGVGSIRFHLCDLTSVPLDDICGKIVELVTRNATVYPKDINKPAQGQGLNVPATIILEHSWPKAARGKRMVLDTENKAYKSHIKRLKEVKDTRFVSYEQDNGAWTFEVDHFTTYALDDEDDEDEEMSEKSSALSDGPATPVLHHEDTLQSIESAHDDLDDTFHFKHEKKATIALPGAFDSEAISFLDEHMEAESGEGSIASSDMDDHVLEDPFLSAASPDRAPSPRAMTRINTSDVKQQKSVLQDEDAIAANTSPEMYEALGLASRMPRSILKPNKGFRDLVSPEKLVTDTWEEQLQRTISPKKRDRLALRDIQQDLLSARQDDNIDSPFKRSILGQSMLGQSYLAQKGNKGSGDVQTSLKLGQSRAFTTSMDIMNSLWANEKIGVESLRTQPHKNVKPKQLDQAGPNRAHDQSFHEGGKLNFNAAAGTISYIINASAPPVTGALIPAMQSIREVDKEVRFCKLAPAAQPPDHIFAALKDSTSIEQAGIDSDEKIPWARQGRLNFARFVKHEQKPTESRAEQQEAAIWKLCSVLFDPINIGCLPFAQGISEAQLLDLAPRIQLDALRQFWSGLVSSPAQLQLSKAKTPEHKALLHLTKFDIAAACEALVDCRDYRLALLVSQLPGSNENRDIMARQILAWQKRKDWSEISEETRTLYSILAGEVCYVSGQDGPPEDKANGFCISERFGLTWQQAFGLRLYYGGNSSVKEAIQAYCHDLEDEREVMTPTTLWDDGADGREFVDKEDSLMTLLRLFVDRSSDIVSTLLEPLTVSGNALESRLSWCLAMILDERQICSPGDETLDKLSISLSTELEARSSVLDAAWVTLHIKDDATRQRAMVAFLEHNADKISSPTEDAESSDFLIMTDYLHIPASLIWAAKALFAANTNPFDQAYWLLRAHEANSSKGYDHEAHDILNVVVAPRAIIEEEYDRLDELFQSFLSFPVRPEGWEEKGGVYHDFLQLLRLRVGQRSSKLGHQRLEALRNGLTRMQQAAALGPKPSLEQRVAALEMQKFANEVAKEVDAAESPMAEGEDVHVTEASGYGLAAIDVFRAYQHAMAVGA